MRLQRLDGEKMAMDEAERRSEVIGAVLRSVRVSSSIFARPELRAPWGLVLAEEEAAFHMVTGGRCLIERDGARGAIALSDGDLVVLPRGGRHVVRDAATTRPVRLDRLLKVRGFDDDGVFRFGGDGAMTTLVCGTIRFEDSPADLLRAILPPLIHVRKESNRLAPWIEGTMAQIRLDLEARRPGAEVVVARFADILFIQAVQAYFEDNLESGESGWLAALRDPGIGHALTLLHLHPERTWSVPLLAREAGLSRSAFAARFVQLVGEPPLRYLNRVRLGAIAERLRSSDEKVSAIAGSFGYDSASGLNKGFKQQFGQTPGEYRRRFSPRSGV